MKPYLPILALQLIVVLTPLRTKENFAGAPGEQPIASGEPRVGWLRDWLPSNIAWESEKIAYRTYGGQFDFFGKKRPRLILKDFLKGDERYHHELEWGMDVLQVGKTPGIGGVTLYINGAAYPVRNPEGKDYPFFDQRLVSLEKERATIETVARGVGPQTSPFTVRFHCSALAGRKDSPIEIFIEGGRAEDHLELGIGLTKLTTEAFLLDKTAGVMGSWGAQTPEIGTIGMGIVFPPERFIRFVDLPEESQVVLQAWREKPVVYHIQGDWLRGRCHDCRPPASDWFDELRALAARLSLR